MRHLNGYRKLGRESSHRRAMLRNLATSFLEHGQITTTVTRAKELRPIVEKIITLGKKGHLHARRQVSSYVFKPEVTKMIFSNISQKFQERQGGYTRILKIGPRHGDGAEMCRIEFVD